MEGILDKAVIGDSDLSAIHSPGLPCVFIQEPCFPSAYQQSGRSPKVVALFSATNVNSYIIELFQLHDTIQIKWNDAWIHYNIAIRSHLMI